MLGNAISSFLYGNTPPYSPVSKPQASPDVKIDIPPEAALVPAGNIEAQGFSSNETHLIFNLLLEHSDAMLDALEYEPKPPTIWEQVMSCFRRTQPKKQENGALSYLLWASVDRNTSAARNAHVLAIQNKAEKEGKPIPSRQEILKSYDSGPLWRFNPNLRNHQGEYLLIRAARNGHYPNAIFKLIAAGAKLDVQDKDGRTALMHTILSGDEAGALALIEAGARLDLVDNENQRNALAYALMEPNQTNLNIATAILDKHEENRPEDDFDNRHDEALFQQRDKEGRIPLTYALENGFQDIAEELIGRSGDLNAADESGGTPLMYAAMDDSEENLVTTLMANGANLHSRDKMLRTPLMYAAHAGSLSSISKLLVRGATVDSQDNKGRTALMYAVKHHNGKLARQMIWELCNRGANLERADAQGRTAVMHAAKNGALESLKFLRELEADLDATDGQGNTALMLAVKHNQPLSILTLCKLGANPNIKNAEGKTAYQNAKEQTNPAALTAFYYIREDETDAGQPIVIDGYDQTYHPPNNRLTQDIARYTLSLG